MSVEHRHIPARPRLQAAIKTLSAPDGTCRLPTIEAAVEALVAADLWPGPYDGYVDHCHMGRVITYAASDPGELHQVAELAREAAPACYRLNGRSPEVADRIARDPPLTWAVRGEETLRSEWLALLAAGKYPGPLLTVKGTVRGTDRQLDLTGERREWPRGSLLLPLIPAVRLWELGYPLWQVGTAGLEIVTQQALPFDHPLHTLAR